MENNKKIEIPSEIEEGLREFVRSSYKDRPGYSWLGEDIYEELEEIVCDELDMCKEVYPSSSDTERFPE